MDTIPLWAQLLALALLILCSAFFAMAETALMAANRHKLRHLAKNGNQRAITTLWLLERTDKLLLLVLIANILLNALIAALLTSMAISAFGHEESVIFLTAAAIAFLLIVFAEIPPKVIGATHPEKISLLSSLLIKPLMRLGKPAIWFVNLFVSRLLLLLRIKPGAQASELPRLSPEELRSIVLEGGNFIPQKHKSILLNLFDLETISVDDIMTPRAQIEALNLAAPAADIKQQLATCYHNKLPVYEGEINRIVGILHVRKALALLNTEEFSAAHIRPLLSTPYYIPPDTGLFAQLQYFQEKRERLGIIVDEYGEVQGLVTLEDIIEEMIGEFTTSTPGGNEAFSWNAQRSCQLEGGVALREVNKRLDLHLPLDGPKTLNGLLLEILQEIPDHPVAVRIDDCVFEIVQAQHQAIKTVKLISLNKH
ncbi:CNNM domain-containing protein [Massilia sp. W12]|uniref:HlyC/CorC family transporter n=1 Tax=Massilia sp. W12 TaxID=3126507 RepID=UPI0030D5412C